MGKIWIPVVLDHDFKIIWKTEKDPEFSWKHYFEKYDLRSDHDLVIFLISKSRFRAGFCNCVILDHDFQLFWKSGKRSWQLKL